MKNTRIISVFSICKYLLVYWIFIFYCTTLFFAPKRFYAHLEYDHFSYIYIYLYIYVYTQRGRESCITSHNKVVHGQIKWTGNFGHTNKKSLLVLFYNIPILIFFHSLTHSQKPLEITAPLIQSDIWPRTFEFAQ